MTQITLEELMVRYEHVLNKNEMLEDEIERLNKELRERTMSELSALGQAQEAYEAQVVLEEKLAKAVDLAEKSIKWLRLYGADVHREAATLAELTGEQK